MPVTAWPPNILLIYPAIPPDTYWSFKYALRFIRRRSAMPPLGLVTAAALLPEGIDLRLVDLNCETLDDADLDWADMVFVSAMRIQRSGVAEIIAAGKHRGVPVAVGGPFATATPEELTGADYLLQGEVEPIAAAWRWSAAAIAEAQARIAKIHVDFRADVVYHYETITRRIRGLFAPFASELNRHGIDMPPQST